MNCARDLYRTQNDERSSLAQLSYNQDRRRKVIDSQGGSCAICNDPFVAAKSAHRDHDHATGRFRAFLCRNCNIGLGNFNDDPARMRRAAAYIEQHRADAVDNVIRDLSFEELKKLDSEVAQILAHVPCSVARALDGPGYTATYNTNEIRRVLDGGLDTMSPVARAQAKKLIRTLPQWTPRTMTDVAFIINRVAAADEPRLSRKSALSRDEAAFAFGVSTATVSRWMKDGVLPFTATGVRKHVDAALVDRVIAASTGGPVTAEIVAMVVGDTRLRDA